MTYTREEKKLADALEQGEFQPVPEQESVISAIKQMAVNNDDTDASQVKREAQLPKGWDQGQIALTQLKVRNYRGFKQAEWPLSPQFSLLIGDNGTGKTAILDALAIAIRTLFAAFSNDSDATLRIKKTDVRHCTYHKSNQITLEPQYPVVIEMTAAIGKQKISWNLTQCASSDAPAQSGYQSMLNISRALQQAVQSGEDVILPVVAYYPCNRLWQGIFSDPLDTLSPDSRFAGYNDCLDAGAGEQTLFAWWKTQTLSALQNRQPSPLLPAVKRAVCECLLEWTDVDYYVQADALLVSNADGHALPFHMLSDGMRNILVMVANIAHRAAILNPHLGEAVLQKTPGFVLIDEIDLHLHPKWQRRVIEDLRRVFPKVQFIATTHSPFMVQSLRGGELVDLNSLPLEAYSDRSIEDIIETVMGVPMPQKSERYQTMMQVAEQYYTLLEQASSANQQETDLLKDRLDELLIPYNDDPAFTACLKLQRAAKLHEDE
ncbi:MAG: AAA family ATPase [Gammaproteobacteria bacterium]|nr:AAA family ATPase [Gammaproteobacteria bacterium]